MKATEERFSEQMEALATDRITHFQKALRGDKPLRPRNGVWTLGDLIFLAGTLNNMMDNLRPFDEDEFRTPVSEIFS